MLGQTMKLWDGSTWDPNDPLPPQFYQAVGRVQNPNQVPMGSPVGNMGTQAPSYAPAAPDAGQNTPMLMAGPAVASTPSLAPTGIFGQLPNATMPKPKAFQSGGIGDKIINGLDAFTTSLLAMRGNPGALQVLQERARQAEIARQEQRDDAREQARASRPQVIPTGNGGYTVINPLLGTIISEKAPIEKPGEQERLLQRYLDPNTPPAERELIGGMLRGAQYNPTIMAPIIRLKEDSAIRQEDHRQQNRQDLRATPTYAQSHPKAAGGGKTTATRVVNGKAYYKIGGAWYDNPEGR